MSSLVKWLETYVLPPASRLAQVRWLVAMRDTFISLLPITMAGLIASLEPLKCKCIGIPFIL